MICLENKKTRFCKIKTIQLYNITSIYDSVSLYSEIDNINSNFSIVNRLLQFLYFKLPELHRYVQLPESSIETADFQSVSNRWTKPQHRFDQIRPWTQNGVQGCLWSDWKKCCLSGKSDWEVSSRVDMLKTWNWISILRFSYCKLSLKMLKVLYSFLSGIIILG